MGAIVGLPVGQRLKGKLKKVIVIEGNLVAENCGHIAKSFRDAGTETELSDAHRRLIELARASSSIGMQNWAKSLEKTAPATLQKYAGPLITESESGRLLQIYKDLADDGIPMNYVYGDLYKGPPKHKVLTALRGLKTTHVK